MKWSKYEYKGEVTTSTLRCERCRKRLLEEYITDGSKMFYVFDCKHYIWVKYGNAIMDVNTYTKIKKNAITSINNGIDYYFLYPR